MTAPKRRFTNEELLAQNKRLASEVSDLHAKMEDLYRANGGVPFDGAGVTRLRRKAQRWRWLYEWVARKARDQKKAQAQTPEPEASTKEFQEWATETFPRIKP